MAPCRSGRKESWGAGGGKALQWESSSLSFTVVYLPLLLFLLVTFLAQSSSSFLVLFNLEFSPDSSLVHPHSAAVMVGLCFASLVFCVFLLYLCIWLSVVQILLGKAEMLLFWI